MIAETLRTNLMALATTYAEATNAPLTAVSKRFYGHMLFFDSFKTGDMSISIDKYDTVIEKMRSEWPKGTPWPKLQRVTFPARSNGSGKK